MTAITEDDRREVVIILLDKAAELYVDEVVEREDVNDFGGLVAALLRQAVVVAAPHRHWDRIEHLSGSDDQMYEDRERRRALSNVIGRMAQPTMQGTLAAHLLYHRDPAGQEWWIVELTSMRLAALYETTDESDAHRYFALVAAVVEDLRKGAFRDR